MIGTWKERPESRSEASGVVAVDFDGVVADTGALKSALLERRCGIRLEPEKLDRSTAAGQLAPDLYQEISLAATTPESTSGTVPVAGSLDGLRELRKARSVVVLTQRRGARLEAARRWLAARPETTGLKVVGGDPGSKQDYCRARCADLLIDDDPAHLIGFGPDETVSVLFSPRGPAWVGWGIRVARSWREIVDLATSRGPLPPYSATLELGRRCQLACRHCFSDSGPWADPGLTTEEAERHIAALADLGVRVLWLSGGEPTLRRDLPRLISRAAARGLVVVVSSNGLVGRVQAERLANTPLARVDVSFDGWRLDHDEIRGGGAFRRAARGIEHLRDAGASVELSLHLRRGMVMGFAEMAERFASLALPLRVAPLLPFGRGRSLAHLCPTWDEFLGWAEGIAAYGLVRRPGASSGRCWAAVGTLAVTSSGSVAPCCYHRQFDLALQEEVDGPAAGETLAQLWQESRWLAEIRRRPPEGCLACGLEELKAEPSRQKQGERNRVDPQRVRCVPA